MQYLFVAIMGYFLGCSNMAYWVSLAKGVDIRNGGSRNLGASNVTILLGWKAGVIVGLHDIGKAAAAVFLAKLLFPGLEYAPAAAGTACVMGHIFPFYLKFKGGKGLASFLGAVAVLNWKLGIALAILLVLVTLVTDFIVLGTLSVSVAAPIGIWLMTGKLIAALILCFAAAVMAFKHKENVKRILNRTEIGLRSAAKGENRIK